MELAQTPRARSLSVLVVDDNDVDVDVTTENLHAAWPGPVRVTRARDGAEAARSLERETFDVCLLDYHLGAESGIDVLRAARARGTDIPVVMLTADADHDVDVAASAAGADDYLDKCRSSPVILERAIRYAMSHRRGVRELREQNLELARVNLELERLDREKNVLLGMAAHDLRNPIGIVQSYAELLATSPELAGTEAAEILETMRRSCAHMTAMIDDLLDVSTIASGTLLLERRPCDLAEVVRGVVAQHTAMADAKKIVLELTCLPVPPVRIDPARFEQVMANLIANALKYSHAGTRVIVRVAPRGEDRVLVSVSDQGIGIAAEFLPRLFRPFERAQRAGTSGEKSTGLGLAIAQRVVEAHGGTIEVSSRSGEGSTFTVVLPVGGDADRVALSP
ncbi:MAG: hybrid sensor histidine kinase/response regulator [Deltaproteobacteria bacterium]|nr:hybrid sensor histidine kinase/response regulator [Deltaproteobacteria bacterium]